MPGTLITNTSTENLTLPYPLTGVVGPGGRAITQLTLAQLAVFGVAPVGTLRMCDLGSSYAGPYTVTPVAGVAIDDLIIYVDPVHGASTNTSPNPLAAVRSWADAERLLAQYSVYLGRCEVVLMTGTPAAAGNIQLLPPQPLGPNAQAFVVRGYKNALDDPGNAFGQPGPKYVQRDTLQQVAGPFAVATVVNSDNAAITFSAAGWTANQYANKNFRVLFTTGAHAGYECGFRHHTAGTTVTGYWADELGPVAVGDQFIVLQIMAHVPCTGLVLGPTPSGLLGDGIQFDFDGTSGAFIEAIGQWFAGGTFFNNTAGSVGLANAAGGSFTIGSPPILPTVTWTNASWNNTTGPTGARFTTFYGVSIYPEPGGEIFGYASLSFDGDGGTAYFYGTVGSFFQMNAPYILGAMAWYSQGNAASQGHHAVNTEFNGSVVVASFALGAYMGVGEASVLAPVTFWNVVSPGAGLDVIHVREGASARVTGDGGTNTGLVSTAAPGTGGFSISATDGGMIQFVANQIYPQASGSQTSVDGVSYDLNTYASSTHLVGSGAGAITVSGVPFGNYNILAKVSTSGGYTVGAIEIALDGATYGSPITLAATYTGLVQTTGLTFLASNASYTATDVWSVNPNNQFANGTTSIRQIAKYY